MTTLRRRRRAVPAAFILSMAALLTILYPPCAAGADTPPFDLRPGDHIGVIGNTLADRMQHDGWLETYLHARFPKHDLVIRNLGFSGDELKTRLRSLHFGTPDEWLAGSAPVPEPNRLTTRIGVRDNRFETTNTRADVVVAFFGYNESFADVAGLDAFKKDLDSWIKSTLAKRYNGKSPPRVVLCSPTAHEERTEPNWPDGRENNRRLALYTQAMAEVANANKIAFVDLFTPTKGHKGERPLTINGVHLTAAGNLFVAAALDRALFGADLKAEPAALEKLRQAVVDKNRVWFNRYRVLDGFNVYGGRAFERYTDRQSNYEDQQRELEIFDVMTANREKRVWAIAKGGDLKVDDSNAPPLIPVKTNKPGTGPNGEHVFLSGEKAIEKMTLGRNLKVTLFASEKEFPELAKPVQMQFDTKGRLWVAAWPSYPRCRPTEPQNDKLLVFEDTDGDGKADKMTVFADGLHCPTGFEFYNNGVLIAQAPDLIFLQDTDGDGKADVRKRVLHGLDSADSHHTSNSFALDPGGALYFQEGTFHHTQVESPYGPARRCANGGVFRYEPRAQKFDVYVTTGFANPHGHVWDRWGQDIVYDGTGANPYHGALFSGHLEFPAKHPKPPQVYQQRTRPCPGAEYLSSRHFPPEFEGNLLVANVIGFQGILRYKVEDKGASFSATELEPILSSSDPNFRPSDLKTGPDGAIWFIDWQNPIIGHLQHAIRDPSRDRVHGRIYRVTYEGRELQKDVPIAGQPIEKLLDLLKDPVDRIRYRAKIELGGRDSAQVIAATKTWLDGLNKSDPDYEHQRSEGLWVHQYHNVVDATLLKERLTSRDFRARAAAARVLCYWRDRVPDALEIFKGLAADEHPRVRLEAVRAASFFTVAEAVEIPLIAADRPSDEYLRFVHLETMRALDPYVKKAIADGRSIAFTTPTGARYFLRNVATDDLVKMTRTEGVNLELLFRRGVRDETRREALAALATAGKKSEVAVLLDALRKQESESGNVEESVVFDHVRLLTGPLAGGLGGVRPELERMATQAKAPLTRELGFVALIAADGNSDRAWSLALKSTGALHDLVAAMPLIRDPSQRAALYPKVEALLTGLPKELSAGPAAKATLGRYVRIELAGRGRTLTLAEVEVYSGGRNVARQGRATQKNTAHGGDAAKAIDGNKSGTYSDGGQTHSEENTNNPWWEVDLGAEVPIEKILIYNRTDGSLGNRLSNFALKVFDHEHRRVVFQKQNLPAPEIKATFEVSGESPERAVRHAAMMALTSVRGKEADAFKALAKFLADPAERPAAVQALQRLPATHWPKEEAKPLLDGLVAYVRTVPVKERTTPAVVDALQLADTLASLLPLSEARAARRQLGELGVRVLRLGTLTDQMLFDKDRLVVQAGRPVEIAFENTDIMPHNVAVTLPGALEEVGNLAEAQAAQPGAADRGYVPTSNKILLKSRLLQPRESQQLAWTAPTKPGVYPYVCTYPGHWRRMHGALYVVADLDEYLADPEGYLAKNPLPVADEPLKFLRPRKEWTLAELAPSVENLSGRSFANGKHLFQVAACVSCHKYGGVGVEIGQDLTKLDPKYRTPAEVLKSVLDPSERMDEKYRTWIFELKSGKAVTGMILEEKDGLVKVIENPLAKAEPLLLKVSEIDDRKKSPNSIMPKGLLDKLTREEVLDLLGYVLSGADPKHKVYQGGHDHGHGH